MIPEVGEKSDSIITLSEYSQFLYHRGHCVFVMNSSSLRILRESIAIVFDNTLCEKSSSNYVFIHEQ